MKLNVKKDNKSLAYFKNNSKRKTDATEKQQQQESKSSLLLTIKRQKKSLFKHKNDNDKCAKTTLRSIGVSLVNLFKINVMLKFYFGYIFIYFILFILEASKY